jgi:hypothetical protein
VFLNILMHIINQLECRNEKSSSILFFLGIVISFNNGSVVAVADVVRDHSNNSWHFGGRLRQCHQWHKAEEGFLKMSCDIFWGKNNFFHSFWRHFRPILGFKDVKNKLSRHTKGVGGGGPRQYYQMTHGEGGLK